MKVIGCITVVLLLLNAPAGAQTGFKLVETFSNPPPQYAKTGGGYCTVANGFLNTQDAYAGFGSGNE